MQDNPSGESVTHAAIVMPHLSHAGHTDTTNRPPLNPAVRIHRRVTGLNALMTTPIATPSPARTPTRSAAIPAEWVHLVGDTYYILSRSGRAEGHLVGASGCDCPGYEFHGQCWAHTAYSAIMATLAPTPASVGAGTRRCQHPTYTGPCGAETSPSFDHVYCYAHGPLHAEAPAEPVIAAVSDTGAEEVALASC